MKVMFDTCLLNFWDKNLKLKDKFIVAVFELA
jgi:hypothetical protein